MRKKIAIRHNLKNASKTGDWRFIKPIVDKEKCVACGRCVSFCPDACIHLKERQSEDGGENGKSKKSQYACVDYDWCKGCGVCVEVCPVKAIKMKQDNEKSEEEK